VLALVTRWWNSTRGKGDGGGSGLNQTAGAALWDNGALERSISTTAELKYRAVTRAKEGLCPRTFASDSALNSRYVRKRKSERPGNPPAWPMRLALGDNTRTTVFSVYMTASQKSQLAHNR